MMTGKQQNEAFNFLSKKVGILGVMTLAMLLINLWAIVMVSVNMRHQHQTALQEQQCPATSHYYERAYPVPEPTETF